MERQITTEKKERRHNSGFAKTRYFRSHENPPTYKQHSYKKDCVSQSASSQSRKTLHASIMSVLSLVSRGELKNRKSRRLDYLN
jgi:hypothetical protein